MNRRFRIALYVVGLMGTLPIAPANAGEQKPSELDRGKRGSAQANTSNELVVTATSPLQVGQPFAVQLRIPCLSENHILWPKRFFVGTEIEEREAQTSSANGHCVAKVEVTVFDRRVLELPAVTAGKRDFQGKRRPVTSAPFAVEFPLDETNLQLRPASPLVDVKSFYLRALPLPLLLFVIWLWARRSTPSPLVQTSRAAAELPPDEEAMERLHALVQTSQTSSGAELKAVYAGISEILRHYVGRRYEFSAKGMNSAELVSRLSQIDDAEPWRQSMFSLLEECDLVQFAELATSRVEASHCLVGAEILVKRSMHSARPRSREIVRA